MNIQEINPIAGTLLDKWDAPESLVRHLRVVQTVSEKISDGLASMGVDLDQDMVSLGAAIHDIGKVVIKNEIDGDGEKHCEAGLDLLSGTGLWEVARFCESHSAYNEDCSLEELIVAAGDRYWKGARDEALDTMICDHVSKSTGKSSWEVYVALDDVFQEVSKDSSHYIRWAQGDADLKESRV